MGASSGPRLSGIQKQVRSLYREFLRVALSKSGEDRCQIESIVSAEFHRNSNEIDRKNFIYIEYLLRRGKKQLEQLKSPDIVGLSSLNMRSRLNDSLKTPEGDWFKIKLTQHDHFEALARIDDALNRVPEDFDVEDWRRFMASYFGHFMSMHREMKFSDGVIHQMLLRELDHAGATNEMWFLLGNHVVRFSKVKFFLITRLHFGVVPDTGLYVAVENDIHHRYFPGGDEVSLEELRVVLPSESFRRRTMM
ncbi:hypothetical protein Ddye_005126 [Dipteronia dyeriana]|uniref:Complex 1 LYR protein domain-containing protein n=1 Tax=Dipteronia dyeriana TaxID=168575 RepID=A0AAD9XFR9_9ROSI|nr:hypothetical protein Ddye_005126 [Dipteronia dyeriana]